MSWGDGRCTFKKEAALMNAGSHIIFISSSPCHFSSVTQDNLLYCSCKGAIEQMTQLMA